MENFADVLYQRRFDIASNIILKLEFDYSDLPEWLKQNKKNEFGKNWAAVSESLISYGELLIETCSQNVAAIILDFFSFMQYGAYGLRALECLIMKVLENEVPVIIDTRFADYKGPEKAVAGKSIIGYVNGWDGWQPSNIHSHALTILPFRGKQMVEQYLEICLRMQRGVFLVLDKSMGLDIKWLGEKSKDLMGKEIERSGLFVYLENESIGMLEEIKRTSLSALIEMPEHYDSFQEKDFWDKTSHKVKKQTFILLNKERLGFSNIDRGAFSSNSESVNKSVGQNIELLEFYKKLFYC